LKQLKRHGLAGKILCHRKRRLSVTTPEAGRSWMMGASQICVWGVEKNK
jgi:hypothetical protein